MDFLLRQQRSRFSDSGKEKQEEFNGFGEGAPASFNEDNKSQSWFSQFSGNVSEDYDPRDTEFAAAVAAAASAIHSHEEAELARHRKMREEFETSRTRTQSRKDAVSRNKSMGQEAESPIRRPSRTSSIRPTPSADTYQNQMRNPSRRNDVETRVVAWEKTEMDKIKNRYDKTRSRILEWENKRKMEAKLKMEKREHELEQRRAANRDHYRYKISRIDQIAGGARGQMEEKRRHEESTVKKEAKKFRSTGKVPVKYFCFYCY